MEPPATSRTSDDTARHPTVAFLGPAGTFTEEALSTQEDLVSGSVPKPTFADVIEAVRSDEVDLGFLPIENSIEGTVSATLDSLVFEVDLEADLAANWPAWAESSKSLIASGVGFPGKHGPTYRRATVNAADKAPDVFQEILAAARTLRPEHRAHTGDQQAIPLSGKSPGEREAGMV